MTDLLNLALEAHGGLARWRNIAQVSLTASFGGTLPWASSGVLAHTVATISTRTAQSSLDPFGSEGHTGHFVTNHAEIRDKDGKVLAERDDPESFYVPDRPWDDLKTVYFAGCALELCKYSIPVHLGRFPGCRDRAVAGGGRDLAQATRSVPRLRRHALSRANLLLRC